MERESAVAKLLTIAGLGFIDAREGNHSIKTHRVLCPLHSHKNGFSKALASI